ncbi:hypothetical protein [Dactylosporangium sp. CA-092794]|uniref:hypothetical protein n=1 Tax=Dactylosporangium sp. CA-092794 TaxID=3239929 RepID=UPI003D8B6ED5
MGLWLKVHREVAGAWRSACYDISRHALQRRVVRLGMAETAEFGPRGHRGRHVARRPQRRRVAATTGVALLVAGGAAGTYLAVAGSLTALRAEPFEAPIAAPAAPAPSTEFPPAAIQPPGPVPTQARPQVRRSAPPPVLALPPVPVPVEVPTQQTTDPESTPTPSPSGAGPSESPSASPSVAEPSPSPSPTKHSKWGRSGADPAPAGQTGAGR